MNKIQRPITLLREDFLTEIQDLCNAFNKEGIPYFVMSDIIKQLVPQIDNVARKETARDKDAYERTLAKSKEAETVIE